MGFSVKGGFVITLLLAVYSCKQPTSKLDVTDEIDRSVLHLIEENFLLIPEKSQVSIALVKEDTQFFYGFTKLNNQLIQKQTETTVFEIASLTKLFTAEALLIANRNNRLKLGQSVAESLPGFAHLDSISLIQLANHTSGFNPLKENRFLQKLHPKQSLITLKEDGLKQYLKTQSNNNNLVYQYSNEGFGVLGYILERTYNKSLDSIFYENFYKPLNLKNTGFITDSKTEIALNTYGFKTSNWKFNIMKGCGGLKSSTQDLSKFMRSKFQLKPVNDQLFEPTFFSKKHAVGYGWHIYKRKNRTFYEHGGLTKGFSSYIALNRTNKTGVVVLSNLSGFGPYMSKMQPFTRQLLDYIER